MPDRLRIGTRDWRYRRSEFPLFSLPVEALIDGARLVLAAVALLTVAIEPVQLADWATSIRDVMAIYVVFAAIILVMPTERTCNSRSTQSISSRSAFSCISARVRPGVLRSTIML